MSTEAPRYSPAQETLLAGLAQRSKAWHAHRVEAARTAAVLVRLGLLEQGPQGMRLTPLGVHRCAERGLCSELPSCCTKMRRVFVRKSLLNIWSGEVRPNGEEWETRPCGIPLFDDELKRAGLCRGCLSGWTHPENYPADEQPPAAALADPLAGRRSERTNQRQAVPHGA